VPWIGVKIFIPVKTKCYAVPPVLRYNFEKIVEKGRKTELSRERRGVQK
jgi:hypothetical protein